MHNFSNFIAHPFQYSCYICVGQNWHEMVFTLVAYIFGFVKYFLVPLETIYTHSEAKNYFKINHPKLMTLSSQIKISFASFISYTLHH